MSTNKPTNLQAVEPSINPVSENNNDSSNDLATATTSDIPAFGWSAYAERVNGRFAMVGFIAILLIEALSRSNFLEWAGFIS
ncbi:MULTISPECIES: chlorophyll a/b-binding protein [Prochlorococcus]|uniref:chlorophyll a/b-binding protein n=1 Tax=Prochlorococcus TaxID=1218 RepID=UPI00053379E1|nr:MULTISPECIES: chlorophyll a/b-binding protein [Prochlorococcus]KGG13319.1 putative high light inducible protein [Prochlorococcus sp. MIT 0601]